MFVRPTLVFFFCALAAALGIVRISSTLRNLLQHEEGDLSGPGVGDFSGPEERETTTDGVCKGDRELLARD